MGNGRRFFSKLTNLFRGGRLEREMEREMTAHLALLEDEFLRQGMPPREAALAARRSYGGVTQAKEMHREERSFRAAEQVQQDLRQACRGLVKDPGFTLVATIALALGIGVNTTLFTAYNAVVLKPLPVSDPANVVRVRRLLASGARGDIQYAFSWPEYVYCRDHNGVFSGLVAASWPVRTVAELAPKAGSRTVQAELVSANYFSRLGVVPRPGRGFADGEDRAPGANPVVVIGYSFWKRAYGGDPLVLGRTMRIGGTAFTIIGVAPEQFTGTSLAPRTPDLWAPASMQAEIAPGNDWLRAPADGRFHLLARLAPGVARQRAQVEADTLIRQFTATYQERDRTRRVVLERTAFLGDTDDPRFQALIAAFMLTVGLVLLVACANVANMMLARGASRQREIAVRLALGAGRGRIVRQLLTESLLLSAIGGAAGLIVSIWTSRVLWLGIEQIAFGPGSGLAYAVNLNPDARVFAYALGASLVAGILFGLSPALNATRPDIAIALKGEVTSFGRRVSRSRVRRLLLTTQVTVSMVLLLFAGLLTRGLLRSQEAAPGFRADGVVVLIADFGGEPAKAGAKQRRLVERLRTVPGIAEAAIGNVPYAGTWTPPMVAGSGGDEAGGRTLGSYASESYFGTLGIGLQRGRVFTREEAAGGAPVAVISQATAQQFWPGADPLGKRFSLDMDFTGKLTGFEVIGVVNDVRFANLTRTDPSHVYLPAAAAAPRAMLLRVAGDRRQTLAGVREAVAEFDPKVSPSLDLFGLDEGPMRVQRTMASAFAMFAASLALLALSVAGVGIYGVMAYLVSQRTKDIGVRIALGAAPSRVLRSVVLDGLRPVLLGIALGLGCAMAASWALHRTLAFPGSSDFLYGVPFCDPVTFGGISLFVVAVASIASAAPARRALRVDPMVALRCD